MDIGGMGPFYAETVSYFGVNVAKAKVLAEKQKFMSRWPIRKFTVKLSTLFVQCIDDCAVSGVVEWDVASKDRNERSVGAANFVLKFAAAGLLNITSESGSVITSLKQPLASAIASEKSTFSSVNLLQGATSQAFSDGRRARQAYEQWFAGLSDGPYKEGVMFWAANRSIKPPQSCINSSKGTDWLAGCGTAQTRLTPSDVRRRTEPDFRLGWNSL